MAASYANSLYGIVVADTVRPDPGTLSRSFEGQVGPYRERLSPVACAVDLLRASEQLQRGLFSRAMHLMHPNLMHPVLPAIRRRATGQCPSD